VSGLLPFLVVGVTSGALYGLAGLGLVLTYRTSGIFNFAHGAFGAAAAYLYYHLYVTNRWPWPVAMLATMIVCGPVAGLLVERVARKLVGKQVATIIVGTVGLLLVIQGTLYVTFGAGNRSYPDTLLRALPGGFKAGGVLVTWAQVTTIAVSIIAAGGLYIFLRLSRLGVAMRAVVDNSELLDLAGTSPARVRSLSWMLGSTFAAASGILVAPKLGLDAGLLILLIVYSFGAVAIGRFASLPLTFLGGLAVGILEALATKQFPRPPLNGLPSAVPFVALIVVLLATPARHLPRHIGRATGLISERRMALRRGPRLAAVSVGLATLLIVPSFAGSRLPVFTNALAFVMMFLSLTLLVRVSGQISLCQAAFFAVGATTFSHLVHDFHVPWLLALLGAGLVAVPLGAVLAIPAIRLSGVYLALLTFGFGILMQNAFFGSWLMWGKDASLDGARPSLGPINGNSETALYYVFLAIVISATGLLAVVMRSRLGRLLRGMADSPLSLTTNGLGVSVTKALVFCLSAFFAAIGGALYLVQTTTVGRDTGFGPFQSLQWLAVLVMFAGTGLILSSFVSAGFLVVLPAYVTGLTTEWQTLLFGIGVLVAVIASERGSGTGRWPGSADPTTRSLMRTRPLPAESENAPVLVGVT
jgi:branched-subunit amino acid ABC-type transport system permease component